MFRKYGNLCTIVDTDRIKTANDWEDIVNKKSTAEGIVIHKNLTPQNTQKVVCEIDLDNYVYIHTTIMASIDLDPGSDHFITRETEKYINTNGDAWPRDELLKDYHTFVDSGVVYVEHDQNPERAKGKVLDAIARDMGDTVLIDLLFCVDKRHGDLVRNIETGIANAVSMGCTTKYTVCSICGNIAHDEKEYCTHVKRQKNQMIRCEDGVYRKACELCYANTFYDCSIVANPAFAGAVFRRLVAADQISAKLFSNLLCKKIGSLQEDDIMKLASVEKLAIHPIERIDNEKVTELDKKDYEPVDAHADIPYRDRNAIHDEFQETIEQENKDRPKGKTKTAKCNDFGSLVVLTKRYDIPSEDRVAKCMFNFIGEGTVGRLVGRKKSNCAIYFSKIGMISNIPSDIITNFSADQLKQKPTNSIINKQAKIDDKELSVERKGMFKPTGERFQILSVTDDDVEVRWLDGQKMGQKEKLARKEFVDKNIKLASVTTLASFDAVWDGKKYQLRKANWNEKQANLLDKYETHIDNVQHDIVSIMPQCEGRRYSKSFNINTKFGNTTFKFISKIQDNNLHLNVESTTF